MRYRIPLYFPFEKEKLIYNIHTEADWIYITAFNPVKEVLPLLQRDNVKLPGEAPELLYEPSERDTNGRERKEEMDSLLPEQQGENQTEEISEAGCSIPAPERHSNYPPGWRSSKCCD